ncbi:MAG: tetratricopeptide repeat protein [Nitrospirota bacterium]
MLRILIFLFILLGNFYTVSAADDIEMLKKAIQTTTNKTELGLLHKKIGDYYVLQGDFKKAADPYINALSFSRGSFPAEERTKMAVYLSWAGRLKEAIEELKLITSEDPSNLKVRIHLARSLSWSGRLGKAIEEAEKVLKESPENKDALIIKANALNWGGDFKTAIPIYKKLLEQEEDFDARLGLTYALLSSGNKKGAQESSRFLHPKYAYQENELKRLIEAMGRATRPNLDIRYSYYKDSDDNQLNRYSIGYGFWAGNWKLDFDYSHTGAQDNWRDTRAEDLFFKAYSKVTESFGIEGGLGLIQFANNKTTNFLTWNIKADVNILNGTAGVSLARNAFTDIAQLIENKIRFTDASLYISQKLTDKLSLSGSYSYRDYSDNNSANDFQFSPSYTFYIKNPVIKSGYRFRYLNFNRQSGSGYFDPNDFISHQIFTSLYFEKEKFYSYMEPYGGYQSFNRYGVSNNDFFGGAYGTLGYKITKNVLFELNAEGGNYALETATGYNYYLVGLRLAAFFK